MTDERLAKLEIGIDRVIREQGINTIGVFGEDVVLLLDAIRAERQKVADMREQAELYSNLHAKAQVFMAMFEGRVIEAEEKIAGMFEVTCLLNCMVYGGERHSKQSEAIVKKALGR
jgi:hypothetical protein